MPQNVFDPLRIARWKALRQKLKHRGDGEQRQLLRSLGEEIRAFVPVVAKISIRDWDSIACQEMAMPLGIVIGAWLNAEPANPAWPGRDRLFLARSCDLVAACSALALAGFFPPGQAAELLDRTLAATGDTVEIPGLEAIPEDAAVLLKLARDSAVESGRSKRRWRDIFADGSAAAWADPAWQKSPAVWRTCLVAEADAEGMEEFRDVAGRGGDAPAGLAALLIAERDLASGQAEEWRAAGWEAMVIDKSDCLGLYRALAAPAGDSPLAVLLDIGRAAVTPSGRFAGRVGAEKLLGELSDEQFNAIMGESLSG